MGRCLALALDAQHVGEVIEQRLVDRLLLWRAEVGDVVRDLDIAHRGERGQQVEALEDEADLVTAHLGTLAVGELREVYAVDVDGAAGGVGEAAEDVEKSRFAGARRGQRWRRTRRVRLQS